MTRRHLVCEPERVTAPSLIEIDALSDDPQQRSLFAGWVACQLAASRATFGEDHVGWSEDELRGKRADQKVTRFVDLAAVEGDQVVGMLSVALPQQDNQHAALLMLAVHPDHRRRGVGRTLATRAEAVARENGRRVVLVETDWAADGDDVSGEQFARPLGYAPAQVMIRSAMRFPVYERQLEATAAGDDVEDAAAFAIEQSWDGVPEEWLADLAVLEQRMSTDAPQGDLDLEEEVWDAERVRRNLDWAREAGRRTLTVVARDLSIGRLVGLTQLQVPPNDPTMAFQQDTLVLREARGNRLGLRLKARAALELAHDMPQVTRLLTWNADDNAHMLAVNADLGYVREGGLREWQKHLDA